MKHIIVLSFLVLATLAKADTGSSELKELRAELDALRKTVSALTETVRKQQGTIDALRSAPAVPAAAPAPAAPAASASAKNIAPYVPEIGVIGDIVAMSTESEEDEEGNDRLSVRELELVLGHDVDPYSRLDVTIAFSDFEEASLEEAYLTYWDLPWDLKGRFGRFRPKIGKAVASHRDSLDTVDEPLVVARYFGAEGLSRTGVDLAGFTPLSGDAFTQQLNAGVLEGGVGEGGELFGETRRRLSYYVHAANFWEATETTNSELGGTYLLGSSDEDAAYEVNAFGVDATLNHFFTPIRKLKLQSEAYFQSRSEANRSHPWGFYALADFRLTERWGLGARYDWVEPTEVGEEDVRDEDRAGSAYLTFYQSEFARWRAQYEHARLADGTDDDRFFLQTTVAIGTHKHQLQ